MNLVKNIAQHFHEVHYGNSWTDVAMKDVLKDISWQQAVKKVGDTNTIAVLVHHMDFYNLVVYARLLESSEKFEHEDSFRIQVENQADWDKLVKRYFDNVEMIHRKILELDESKLFELKTANTLYKNLHGLVEHIHYHLGQISLLKKLTAGA